MATQQEINTLLELLSTLPNCPITTPETRDLVRSMYFAALGDIPFQWLQAAYLQYIGQDKPFFPANPGTLREIAFDLEMTAQGVPTASQAWAMVLRGPQMIEARICETNAAMRETLDPTARDYFLRLGDLDKHEKSCDVCMPTSKSGSYGSKIVDEVVRMMGGRDVIFTDNATADRARFLDSYREMVLIERKRLQMHPKVAELIGDPHRPRIGQVAEGMRLLAGQMGGTP